TVCAVKLQTPEFTRCHRYPIEVIGNLQMLDCPYPGDVHDNMVEIRRMDFGLEIAQLKLLVHHKSMIENVPVKNLLGSLTLLIHLQQVVETHRRCEERSEERRVGKE